MLQSAFLAWQGQRFLRIAATEKNSWGNIMDIRTLME